MFFFAAIVFDVGARHAHAAAAGNKFINSVGLAVEQYFFELDAFAFKIIFFHVAIGASSG
jgi:hypothetical protein